MKLIPSAEIAGSRFIAAGSHYFVNSAVSSITQAQKEKGSFELHTYYDSDTPQSTVLNELLTEPFFDDFKVVIFHLTEQKGKKSEINFKVFMVDFRGVFIITSEDAEKAEKIGKILSNYKLITEKKQSPREKNSAVQALFAEHKLHISLNTAERISKAMAGDMALIAFEAEKLSLYYHNRTPKNDEELLGHISVNLHEDRWGFADAFLSKNMEEALKVLSRLQEREEVATILFYTLPHYYAAIYFRLKYPKFDLYKLPLLKTKSFIVSKSAGFTRFWTEESIAEAISCHRELEVRIKTSNLSYFDALILLLKP
ncbi:MAG: hypothetical protein LBD73_04945 [Deferribacteraceae bacterium]|jgi:DNA polymerase III delta subunit|nr:hypothetical protein [Deferribacteraceae bacterium]